MKNYCVVNVHTEDKGEMEYYINWDNDTYEFVAEFQGAEICRGSMFHVLKTIDIDMHEFLDQLFLNGDLNIHIDMDLDYIDMEVEV